MTTRARAEEGRRPAGTRTLAFGPVAVALATADAAAAEWLAEVVSPWFAATRTRPDWHVTVTSGAAAYAALRSPRPRAAAARACFAHDTRVVALPAWPSGAGAVALADDTRGCVLVVAPARVELVGDPATRRWRMPALWALHEIAAARLRRTHLDVHAAAVEAGGRGVLVVGPKGAGKTTLSLHLLRAGGCRAVTNDRAFVGPGAPFEVRGVPTPVTVRPPTAAAFPELTRGLPAVERPYLHTLAELARARPGAASTARNDLSLTPAQILGRLGAEARAAAPLAAIVFPEIRRDADGSAVARLAERDVAARIRANLYGSGPGPRPPTVFEDAGGGFVVPPPLLADALAAAVPGYRVTLGGGAYDQPGFAARLLDAVLGEGGRR